MKWTVSRRIAAGYALLLVMMLIGGALASFALRRSAVVSEQALGTVRHRLVPATEAQSDWRRARVDYLRLLVQFEPTLIQSADSLVAAARTRLVSLRDSSTAEPQEQALWIEIIRDLDAWRVSAREIGELTRAGRRDDAVRLFNTTIGAAADTIGSNIISGIDMVQRRTDQIAATSAAMTRRMQLLIAISSILSLVLGVVAAVLLNKAVNGPLRETSVVLASSAAEILAATTQQASGSNQSSAAVTETVSTVEEVTQTAEQAADRARAVADSARRTAEIGKSGLRAIETSVEGMAAVREQVEATASSIVTLAEQAQAIGEIIASVNDIAEQTNLLALNAAVEAARAGEHGRGFAVVAAEVKNLAQQSKKATVQVRQILGEIQRATNAAVMVTEQGTKQVASMDRQVREAGDTIRALADSVADASQVAAQIVASAGQQALGMSQIREAMANIHQATQQNLAATKQAERAAQDLNQFGGRLLALTGATVRPHTNGRA
ncbi:HAMP domain-containing methyl-accepting chemotaxis protein [Gemmatimonas aurantiaca]|nr:methyl-accepting chemotaxis protein [Gemmatimonas aurantiaca]